MTSFTPEDLLLYLYKESSPLLTNAIEKALQKDWTLREKFIVMRDACARLDSLKQSPRTEAVLSILDYAKACQAYPTQKLN